MSHTNKLLKWHKCDNCPITEYVVVIPTEVGDRFLCLECAGKFCLERLKVLPMGEVNRQ